MKLVVEYSTGQYDSHCNHVYCVEYDSKEQFLNLFKSAFATWVVHHKNRLVLHAKMRDARASGKLEDMQITHQAWKDYAALYPQQFNLIVDGHSFAGTDDYDNNYQLAALPEVSTLDEWFESHRPQKEV